MLAIRTSGIVLANGISIPNPSLMSNFSVIGASVSDHAPNESSEASKSDSTCARTVDCKKGRRDAEADGRIAERTAACSYASAVSKKAPLESKAAESSMKGDMNKNLATAQTTNRDDGSNPQNSQAKETHSG